MQVTFIGAGSAVFTNNLTADIMSCPALTEDLTISLMDVDAKALRLAEQVVKSIAATLNVNVKVKATTDRRKALAGSDFVIVTIRARGLGALESLRGIPQRYGLQQTVADTVGIGGIFYGLRHMPILLSIARDVEELCPDAWILNYANPMAMNTLALVRGTRAKVVGLCHSVQSTTWRLRLFASLGRLSARASRDLLGSNPYPMHWPHQPPAVEQFMKSDRMIPEDQWHVEVAGINHFAAFLKLQWQGQDAYPLLEKAAAREEISRLEPTRFEMFRRLGYFITESSQHLSEYVPYFMHHPDEVRRMMIHKRPGPMKETSHDYRKEYQRLMRKGESVIDPGRPAVTIEYAWRIIRSIYTGEPDMINGNVHNRGGQVIPNLPGDCCVEVPCLIDRNGVQPKACAPLPAQLAAILRTNINVQDLAVRAVLEEDRRSVYHAAMMDPNTAATLTLPQIWSLVDELLALFRREIPAGLARRRPMSARD